MQSDENELGDFNQIPINVLIYLLFYFDPKELSQFIMPLCKSFNKMANHNALWMRFIIFDSKKLSDAGEAKKIFFQAEKVKSQYISYPIIFRQFKTLLALQVEKHKKLATDNALIAPCLKITVLFKKRLNLLPNKSYLMKKENISPLASDDMHNTMLLFKELNKFIENFVADKTISDDFRKLMKGFYMRLSVICSHHSENILFKDPGCIRELNNYFEKLKNQDHSEVAMKLNLLRKVLRNELILKQPELANIIPQLTLKIDKKIAESLFEPKKALDSLIQEFAYQHAMMLCH